MRPLFLLGIELQVYPAGQQLTAQAAVPLAESHALTVDVGINRARRRDWALHDDERGAGPGGGIAYRFQPAALVVEARADVWWLPINWTQGDQTGRTNTLVAQPSARLGWSVDAGPLTVEPGISLGWEINVVTRGEPVGQGAILLGGIGIWR